MTRRNVATGICGREALPNLYDGIEATTAGSASRLPAILRDPINGVGKSPDGEQEDAPQTGA